MIERAGQVWEHEDGELLVVIKLHDDKRRLTGWWTTFSLLVGRLNTASTHDHHFEDWENLKLGWVRLA